nr:MAG TPA: hypothetical protein [Caudoviricetes sp.]
MIPFLPQLPQILIFLALGIIIYIIHMACYSM